MLRSLKIKRKFLNLKRAFLYPLNHHNTMLIALIHQMLIKHLPKKAFLASNDRVATSDLLQLTSFQMLSTDSPKKLLFTSIRAVNLLELANLIMFIRRFINNPLRAPNIIAPDFPQIANQLMLLQLSSDTFVPAVPVVIAKKHARNDR